MRSADDPYSSEWPQPRYQSNAQWIPSGSQPPGPNRQATAPSSQQWQQATQVPTSANGQQRPAGKVVEIPVVRVSSGSQPRDIPIRVERVPEQPSTPQPSAPQPTTQPAPQPAPREERPVASEGPNDQSKSQFDAISAVLQEAQQLEDRVEQFSKSHKDREYLLLDDLLARCIHDLDQVDANGNETVRQARRDAIRKIQSVMDRLDQKSGKKEAAKDTSAASAPKLKKTSGK